MPTGKFPGATYRRHFATYPDGWRDTSSTGVYAPTRVLDVASGRLRWHVRTQDGEPLGAAVVVSPTYGQTYGRFQVRWRSDAVKGYGLAFLLWPDSEQWPADGEIDFPEASLDGTITATAHHADPEGGTDTVDTGISMTAWHESTIEWTAGQLRFLLDGVLVGSSVTEVPSRPMHWVLQVGTNGSGPPPADAAGLVEVDWIQVDAMR